MSSIGEVAAGAVRKQAGTSRVATLAQRRQTRPVAGVQEDKHGARAKASIGPVAFSAMTRLRLVLLLVVLTSLGIATPARAGLLDSLLGGGSDDTEATASPSEATTLPPCQPTTVPVVELGLGDCSGVYPGARIESGGGQCTLNFLFGGGGERFVGTAGHCILSSSPLATDNGEQVFAEGEGPEVLDSDGNRIGEYAYAIQEQPKDFALIRLDDNVPASPQVRQFGGPTGVNDEITSDVGSMLFLTGNPLGIGGPLAVGRTLVAADLSDPDVVTARGLVLPGDSGGPALDDQGRAVGSLLGVTLVGTGAGEILITRLTPQLEQAERAMNLDLTLQTAPRL